MQLLKSLALSVGLLAICVSGFGPPFGGQCDLLPLCEIGIQECGSLVCHNGCCVYSQQQCATNDIGCTNLVCDNGCCAYPQQSCAADTDCGGGVCQDGYCAYPQQVCTDGHDPICGSLLCVNGCCT